MIIIQIPLVPIIRDTTLCDKVCQSLTTGRWFSSCTPVSSTNKTERHDITEILLNVELKHYTLKLTLIRRTTIQNKENPLLLLIMLSSYYFV